MIRLLTGSTHTGKTLLAQRLLDEGYLIAPGALFHATRQPCTLMRINFGTAQDAHFWKALRAFR